MPSQSTLKTPILSRGVYWFHSVPKLAQIMRLSDNDAQTEAVLLAEGAGEDWILETYASLFIAASAMDHDLGYHFAAKGFDAARESNDHAFWHSLFKANRDLLSRHIVSAYGNGNVKSEYREAMSGDISLLSPPRKKSVGLKVRIENTKRTPEREAKRRAQKHKLRVREEEILQQLSGLSLGDSRRKN